MAVGPRRRARIRRSGSHWPGRWRISAAIPLPRENHALRRIVERDAHTAKLVEDAKVHGLLQVEQRIHVGLLHEIRELEMQGRIAQGLEVAALEARARVFANDA